jgi:hypothetical protein
MPRLLPVARILSVNEDHLIWLALEGPPICIELLTAFTTQDPEHEFTLTSRVMSLVMRTIVCLARRGQKMDRGLCTVQ